MRVRNEGLSIDLCIESCIPALDELIIVYQPSEDNTEEKIRKFATKYPEKIKVYCYDTPIFSHKLSPEKFKEVSQYPENSPHLLSSYYNFTLSKANYKYALKIDADQIYNTSRLKKICDAYRSTKRVKISFREKFTAKLLHIISNLNWISHRLFGTSIAWSLGSEKLSDVYNTYVFKKINNDKNPVNLSGINLSLINGELVIPISDLKNRGYPAFNGTYDHIIFEISHDTYYEKAPYKTSNYKYELCVIEKFHYDKILWHKWGWDSKLLQAGFVWWHIAPLRDHKKPENGFLTLSDFRENGFDGVKYSLTNKKFVFSRFWFKIYLNCKKTDPSERSVWLNSLNSIKSVFNIKDNL